MCQLSTATFSTGGPSRNSSACLYTIVPNLSDAEKLVYLQQSLRNGSAKSAIDGLSRSGEYYAEAVKCLKSRYDRPRLIHQTYVRVILEAPPLKDGSGKELRGLHNIVQQHLRALKTVDYEPSGPFITSILELKLDAYTSGRSTAKTPLTYRTTRSYWSLSIFAHKHRKPPRLVKGVRRFLIPPLLHQPIPPLSQ